MNDLPWSRHEIETRIKEYDAIAEKVKQLSKEIPQEKQHSWFQLIEYPVCGAAEMNKKHLYAQLARHGLDDWQKSDTAYYEIVALTAKYNNALNGKWDKMMDFSPRKLTVFEQVPHTVAKVPLLTETPPLVLFNGNAYTTSTGSRPTGHGLGYQSGAVHIEKGSSVSFTFEHQTTDSLIIEVTLVPCHPIDGDKIRYAISLDGEPDRPVNYATKGRSEEWKQNVLRNRAIRRTVHLPVAADLHTIKIIALDEGVTIDQVKVINR